MLDFKGLLERHSEGSRFSGFHKLMQKRVREILLVSSPYDAFLLAEDGKLQEQMLGEFIEHNLTYAPNITRVSSGREALELARNTGRFNLIISTMHIEDMEMPEFATHIRENGINTPLILLTYDNRALAHFVTLPEASLVNRIFIWQGDFRILLTIVKYIEDLWNVEDDIHSVGVQVIIVVENNIKFYSSYLPMIYTELIKQSQSLIAEGVNLLQKLLRMRARPKILLCTDFEQTMEYYQKFKANVLGIISDVRFPHNGELDSIAGFELARHIKSDMPDIPILLQSTEKDNVVRAQEVGASFLYKNSPTLLHEVRQFMVDNFAFGDFVFRLPTGVEVSRASDLKAFEDQLETIPEESLRHHIQLDHFSDWLKARTEFQLAHDLKWQRLSEHTSMKHMRHLLVTTLREHRLRRYRGEVVDFNPNDFETSVNIGRIGYGSIGGKARGMAFVSNMLVQYGIRNLFQEVRVFVPASVVLGTDVFDEFLEKNNLGDFALNCQDDQQILERFLAAQFPEDARKQLASYLQGIKYPLAVRSSSILEDSLYQPFAGVYKTYMIPNNHNDLEIRLTELITAVKGVWASTFYSSAKSYIKATSYRLEEEKMAVIIQRILGNRHENRFYPHFAGVARSHNSYPNGPMKPEDGIAAVALGLGKMVVEGGTALHFCPRYPNNLIQLSNPREFVQESQRQFFAVDLHPDRTRPLTIDEMEPISVDLTVAEKDGELTEVASTYIPENDSLYDGLSRPGPRVITFAPILKYKSFPLAEILHVLMGMGEWGMNSPVEIEFAIDLRPSIGGDQHFGVLQMRPLVLSKEVGDITIGSIPDEKLICRSHHVLGNGKLDNIYDIILVDNNKFERGKSKEVALEVAHFNRELSANGTPYILIGMGRWGSADPWLGIPVRWDQISGVRCIIETGFQDFRVTPSQGSHFFQNLTSFMVGYFTVNPDLQEELVNWNWLLKQEPLSRSNYVSHLRFNKPLIVKMNSHTMEGVIFKPGEA